MARREFQDPSVLERETPRGIEFYIRYRVKALKGVDSAGRPVFERREKWQPLGLKKDGANARNTEALTYSQAERAKAAILARVNGQVYTFQAQIPFRDLVALFQANHLPTLAVPSQNTYRTWIAAHILPVFGDRAACDIKPIDIQAWYLGLKVADSTKRSIRGVLASIFARAHEWEYLDSVPLMPLGGRKKSVRRVRPKRIPTPAEVRQILDTVRPDVRLIIETLVWTGLRISECLGLRPRHFDLARGIVHIEERQCRGDIDDPKSESGERDVPLGTLTEKYRVWLQGKDPDAFVFTDRRGRPYQDNTLLANYLTYRLRKLGLKWPGFGWHTFRRLLATWMSESGVNPFDLMEQLGHSDIRTTTLYVVGGVKRRAKIVEQMQKDFAKGATA